MPRPAPTITIEPVDEPAPLPPMSARAATLRMADALLAPLGIDPSRVTALTIGLRAAGETTITATLVPDPETVAAMAAGAEAVLPTLEAVLRDPEVAP